MEHQTTNQVSIDSKICWYSPRGRVLKSRILIRCLHELFITSHWLMAGLVMSGLLN